MTLSMIPTLLKRPHRFLSLLALALLAPLALAQDVEFSPRSIVVNPLPSFSVEVFVDRDGSGEGNPTYEIGESIRIGVRVSEDAYVYLFSVKASGEIQQILPNRYDEAGRNNFVRVGQTTYFPPRGALYEFTVDGPRGQDKVLAVASKRELNTSELARFEQGSAFATSDLGQDAFAERLSIVVRPLPQREWVTDAALFRVGQTVQAPPAPRNGTLAVDSSPRGARVFVDGRFVGQTPLRTGLATGEHDVRLELDGYRSYGQRVRVEADTTRSLDVDLERVAPVSQPLTVVFEDPRLVLPADARLTSLRSRSREADATFESRASLQALYDAFHEQLGGWERYSYDVRGNRIDTRYRRGGQRLQFEIKQRGNSGQYELEIDLKGDDDDDDD